MAFSRSEEMFKVHNVVFAQGRDDNGDGESFYMHYPAQIMHVYQSTVFCRWIDPQGAWKGEVEQVANSEIVEFNKDNIQVIKNQFENKKDSTAEYWTQCVEKAKMVQKDKADYDKNKHLKVNQNENDDNNNNHNHNNNNNNT